MKLKNKVKIYTIQNCYSLEFKVSGAFSGFFLNSAEIKNISEELFKICAISYAQPCMYRTYMQTTGLA